MTNSNRLLSALGLDNSVFFYTNTVYLFDKGKNKPFGLIEVKNGTTTLRVGGDIRSNGSSVDVRE